MKAVVYREYGPPDVLRLEEVEKPVPKDDEVLIRIRATTVTSEDCTFRKGHPFIARVFVTGLTRPKYAILGQEFAGEVEAVGSAVRRFKPGDHVFGATGDNFGAHAEYIAMPEDGALATMPAAMSHEEAAAVCGGVLTALPFLRDAGNIRSGKNVLIYGASGSVGSSAVQLATNFGANVTGVCSTRNLELVKSLGAERVIDYTNEDFTQSGETYDIIFDAVGKSSFSRCRGSLRQGGIYLRTVPTPAILLQMLWTSKIGSRKAKITFTGLRPTSEKTKDLVFLKELVEGGKITAVIDTRYPLEQIAEAHRYVDTGHKRGSVVITVAEKKT